MPEDEWIGTRLYRLRLERNWSQAELADKASLSPQTISNIENHRHYPQPGTIWNIAEALGVTWHYLVRGTEVEDQQWKHNILTLEQTKLGAKWIERDGRFSIDPAGVDSDVRAARDPIVRQLHRAVADKARDFTEISYRLDNLIGWRGIAAAAQRFSDGVQRGTDSIPNLLGSIYSASLELGSFLDLDIRLQGDVGHTADALEPEVHRALSDLIRTAAPWLRRFPTVRELDDECGAFLARAELLAPAATIIRTAKSDDLVTDRDADAIAGLIEAAARGEFQGQKARARSVLSVKNLVWASASAIALFMSGAVASNYAGKSLLIDRAGTFLTNIEEQVRQFSEDLPDDIRIALSRLIEELRGPRE